MTDWPVDYKENGFTCTSECSPINFSIAYACDFTHTSKNAVYTSVFIFLSAFFCVTAALSHTVLCPAGSFSSGGVCSPCPRDTFQAEEGQVFCSPCPTGTSTVAQGAFSPSHCE